MKSARVDRISLVSKAASRIPFKVIKEDSTMSNPLKQTIDLASVGAIFKSQKPIPAVPEIAAIVTLKNDNLTTVLAAVEAAGFSVKKSDEQEDGSVLIEQTEGLNLSEGIVVLKMGDHTALVVKGFTPYDMQMGNAEGATFADICKAQGFYPGLRSTMDVLSTSVSEVAMKSEDSASAVESVSKMFDEAKAYAVALVTALPAKAFKLEAIEAAPAEADAVTTDAAPAAPAAETPPAEEDVAKMAKDKMKPATAADAEDATDGGKDEALEDKDGKVVSKPAMKADAGPDFQQLLSAGLADIASQLKATMSEMLVPVQKSVEGVQTSLEGLTTKVEQVEGVAKAAKEAVAGTVMGHDAGGDATTSVQKSGDNGYGRGREIDTGMSPRRRTATR